MRREQRPCRDPSFPAEGSQATPPPRSPPACPSRVGGRPVRSPGCPAGSGRRCTAADAVATLLLLSARRSAASFIPRAWKGERGGADWPRRLASRSVSANRTARRQTKLARWASGRRAGFPAERGARGGGGSGVGCGSPSRWSPRNGRPRVAPSATLPFARSQQAGVA